MTLTRAVAIQILSLMRMTISRWPPHHDRHMPHPTQTSVRGHTNEPYAACSDLGTAQVLATDGYTHSVFAVLLVKLADGESEAIVDKCMTQKAETTRCLALSTRPRPVRAACRPRGVSPCAGPVPVGLLSLVWILESLDWALI